MLRVGSHLSMGMAAPKKSSMEFSEAIKNSEANRAQTNSVRTKWLNGLIKENIKEIKIMDDTLVGQSHSLDLECFKGPKALVFEAWTSVYDVSWRW